ncbi:MAG TPA: cytochrome P450 [Dehalococcoidia bacterium]|jgi:cytochrome P450
MVEQGEQSGGIFDGLLAQGGNPFPIFAQLRKTAPVMKFPGDNGFWGIFKYDDCLRILRDPETFSSMVDARSIRGEKRPPTILFDDAPIHTRMRGLISKAFTPRVIELQREAIQANCDAMIGHMLESETADFVDGLAYPLPVQVIAAMLGVQGGDMATFKRWSDAIIENVATALIDDSQDALAEINAEFDAYFTGQLDKLRAHREDNLLSELIHAETEEGKLSSEDLLIICRVLLVAGNETTTGLLVNLARVFSEFPQVLAQVKENPSLIPGLIEETLRYYPPFPATIRRAMKDVELSGVTIPKGDRILVMLASANHDETAFERADEFIVDRAQNRHIGFGMGIHYCLGAPLARLEADVALHTLLPRITALTIESAEDDALMRPGGPKALQVRFEFDRSAAAV